MKEEFCQFKLWMLYRTSVVLSGKLFRTKRCLWLNPISVNLLCKSKSSHLVYSLQPFKGEQCSLLYRSGRTTLGWESPESSQHTCTPWCAPVPARHVVFWDSRVLRFLSWLSSCTLAQHSFTRTKNFSSRARPAPAASSTCARPPQQVQAAPAPHTKQCGFPHPPRKCGYPQPARVNPLVQDSDTCTRLYVKFFLLLVMYISKGLHFKIRQGFWTKVRFSI